jgi:pyridoxine 4-dehydrogenase
VRVVSDDTFPLGDRSVRRIGFGAMQLAGPGAFGPPRDRDSALDVLRKAVELGVDHIDTAQYYGPDVVNALIRAALWPYPEDLLIATKVGPGEEGWARTPAQLRAQVEENLRRLGRDHLDLVNLRLRGPEHGSCADEYAALAELQDRGLIRHLGLSAATLAHVDEAQAIAPVTCVQNSYGVDYRRGHDDLVRTCGERGIAFVPFFSLAGDAREKGAGQETNEVVQRVAAAHGGRPSQVRLAWALHQGPHVLVIPGTGSVTHLEENVAAAALRLTPEQLATL